MIVNTPAHHDHITLTDALISKVYTDYHSRLCLFAAKFVIDHTVIEDLVQDCFEQLLQQKNSLRIRTSLPVYLYSMVKNRCFNHLRSQKKNSQEDIYSTSTDQNALQAMIEAETYYDLHCSLQTLPEKSGEVIRMVYLDQQSHEQAAQSLKITPSTVRNHKARALSLLRQKLRELSHLKFF